jgi:tRNA pseudouridine38-40 synthase
MMAMNEACRFLTGRHDFTSFSKLHTDVRTHVCEVFDAGWHKHGDLLLFRVTADRFLRNMVRALVGTLLEVGKGKIPPEAVACILEAKDRSKAGMSVPARGLFLAHVEYSPEVFTGSPKPPFPDWPWLEPIP